MKRQQVSMAHRPYNTDLRSKEYLALFTIFILKQLSLKNLKILIIGFGKAVGFLLAYVI